MVADQAGGPEDEPVEMRCDPSSGIFERSPVARPHDGQELIQFQVAVDGDRSAVKGLERRRMSNGDGSEEDAHRTSTTARPVNVCGLFSRTANSARLT